MPHKSKSADVIANLITNKIEREADRQTIRVAIRIEPSAALYARLGAIERAARERARDAERRKRDPVACAEHHAEWLAHEADHSPIAVVRLRALTLLALMGVR
jgi:hypothetical protein